MDHELPSYVTHYYRDQPFRTLTDLSAVECEQLLQARALTEKLPRRLQSPFYFRERRRYEELMHEQFIAKGGRPQRKRPHYAILGESELWARIYTSVIRIPVAELPDEVVSFTYTDSFGAYVDRDLDENPIPRKPQYGMVYRWEELEALIQSYGWPGDRWKTEPEWEHDLYVEAQIWSDDALRKY